MASELETLLVSYSTDGAIRRLASAFASQWKSKGENVAMIVCGSLVDNVFSTRVIPDVDIVAMCDLGRIIEFGLRLEEHVPKEGYVYYRLRLEDDANGQAVIDRIKNEYKRMHDNNVLSEEWFINVNGKRYLSTEAFRETITNSIGYNLKVEKSAAGVAVGVSLNIEEYEKYWKQREGQIQMQKRYGQFVREAVLPWWRKNASVIPSFDVDFVAEIGVANTYISTHFSHELLEWTRRRDRAWPTEQVIFSSLSDGARLSMRTDKAQVGLKNVDMSLAFSILPLLNDIQGYQKILVILKDLFKDPMNDPLNGDPPKLPKSFHIKEAMIQFKHEELGLGQASLEGLFMMTLFYLHGFFLNGRLLCFFDRRRNLIADAPQSMMGWNGEVCVLLRDIVAEATVRIGRSWERPMLFSSLLRELCIDTIDKGVIKDDDSRLNRALKQALREILSQLDYSQHSVETALEAAFDQDFCVRLVRTALQTDYEELFERILPILLEKALHLITIRGVEVNIRDILLKIGMLSIFN